MVAPCPGALPHLPACLSVLVPTTLHAGACSHCCCAGNTLVHHWLHCQHEHICTMRSLMHSCDSFMIQSCAGVSRVPVAACEPGEACNAQQCTIAISAMSAPVHQAKPVQQCHQCKEFMSAEGGLHTPSPCCTCPSASVWRRQRHSVQAHIRIAVALAIPLFTIGSAGTVSA